MRIRMDDKKTIRIGTRGSKLALIQTEMVIAKLSEVFPDYIFEKIEITTKGDRDKVNPIYEFGGKAVFVEDIEKAILDGTIDLAVHSAKDMPMPCAKGLAIAGVLKRANPCDVLIYRRETKIRKDSKITIGTSSLRRKHQITKLYPNAICSDLRGNIGTRIRKLKEGRYDAIILAAAGIERQGLDKEEDLIYEKLELDDMLPAAGQGIIAIETVATGIAFDMVSSITDKDTQFVLHAERAVLEKLGATCHEPMGVYATTKGNGIELNLMRLDNGIVMKNKVWGKQSDLSRLIEKLCEE